MRTLVLLLAVAALVPACDSGSESGKEIEIILTEDDLAELPTNQQDMNRLDRVMGTLLETWEQRYTFEHDREEPRLTFTVPGFTLAVVEDGAGEGVAILFEEAGTKHQQSAQRTKPPRLSKLSSSLNPTLNELPQRKKRAEQAEDVQPTAAAQLKV